MKKHNGISLVELLGAIVIFAIASSIIALTISLIVNANKDIIETGQANTTGLLIIRQIENELNDMNITDYDLISSEEIVVYSDSEYIFDEVSGQIVLITHDPILSLSLKLSSQRTPKP